MTHITKHGLLNNDLPPFFYEKEKKEVVSESIYGLFEMTEYSGLILKWTHDFNGNPLRSEEQCQSMIELIGDETMMVQEINN